MRKAFVLVLVGVVVGVLGTLGVQRALKARGNSSDAHFAHLFQSAEIVIPEALPGARVLDVQIQSHRHM